MIETPTTLCVCRHYRQARVVLDTFHGGLLHISPIHLDNLRVSFGEGVGGRPRPLQAAPRRLPSEPDRRGWWLTLTMVGFNTLREFILSICEYRSGKAVAPNRRCRAAWQPPRTLNAFDAPSRALCHHPRTHRGHGQMRTVLPMLVLNWRGPPWLAPKAISPMENQRLTI